MRLNKSLKNRVQKITDLCCCVNAFDSHCMEQPTAIAKRWQKVWDRQRKALTDTVLEHAQRLHDEVAPMTSERALKVLEKALVAGGWDDNYFKVDANGTLKIEYRI